MKGYLIDENIPGKLLFSPSLPVVHATTLGASVSDSGRWSYAARHALAIVTKDADFSHRIMISQPPPWVMHLRFGNLRRRESHRLLLRVWPQIKKFFRRMRRRLPKFLPDQDRRQLPISYL